MITKRDLAEHFGVSARTVNRWVADQRIPAPSVRLGTTVRWRIADLEPLIGANA